MSDPVKKCGTCKHLAAPVDVDGRRHFSQGYGYPCKVPLPDLSLVLPHSDLRNARPTGGARHMGPEAGLKCPTWVYWKDKEK